MLQIRKDGTDGSPDAKIIVSDSLSLCLIDKDYNYLIDSYNSIKGKKEFCDYVLEHIKLVVKKESSEELMELILKNINTRSVKIKQAEWIGMSISAVYTDKQLSIVKKQWELEGSYKKCPWWKYVLLHAEIKIVK